MLFKYPAGVNSMYLLELHSQQGNAIRFSTNIFRNTLEVFIWGLSRRMFCLRKIVNTQLSHTELILFEVINKIPITRKH